MPNRDQTGPDGAGARTGGGRGGCPTSRATRGTGRARRNRR